MISTQTTALDSYINNSNTLIPILNAKTGLNLELNLLQSIANGRKTADFLLWRCKQSLVVPKSFSRKPNFELTKKYLSYIGWPVILRETGGDLTPQSPGIINIALVFRCSKKSISIRDSYLQICNPIIETFSKMGIQASYGAINGSFCDGDYNVTVDDKKIAGTAQRWKNINSEYNDEVAILVQAAILIDGPFNKLWQVSNEFYKRSNIDYLIEEDKHIALNDILGESGEKLIKKFETQVIKSLENWLIKISKP